jgi:hypothetical protein
MPSAIPYARYVKHVYPPSWSCADFRPGGIDESQKKSIHALVAALEREAG